MYLFIALHEVVDGSNARTGDQVVQLGLLRFAAVCCVEHWTVEKTFCVLGEGNFINHMVDGFGAPFSTPFKAALVFALTALLPMVLVAEEVNMRPAKLAIVPNSPLPLYAYFQA